MDSFPEFAGNVIYLLDQLGLLEPLQFFVVFGVAIGMARMLWRGE
jgi:hypothetical protein